MRIYLIEDSDLKVRKIKEFLLSEFGVDFTPEVFGSYHSGLRAMQANVPDLAILDMTLPNFDRTPSVREGKPRPLGGYDLMRKMKLHGMVSKAIVVTQLEAFGEGAEKVSFRDITAIAYEEFPGLFLGSVYFDQASSRWQSSLGEMIRGLPKGD
jgi:DNA-binding response OmpR family regulator